MHSNTRAEQAATGLGSWMEKFITATTTDTRHNDRPWTGSMSFPHIWQCSFYIRFTYRHPRYYILPRTSLNELHHNQDIVLSIQVCKL